MMDTNTTTIIVRDFTLEALIGIYPNEITIPQRICVNVDMVLGNPDIQHDMIEDTVSYEGIVAQIRQLAKEHHNLVETLADKLANYALLDVRVKTVKITLVKLDVFSEGAVGVDITRSRK
ncbi:MAG: dihydroneopterin aldolase [Pseudobdellovibrionaceae bacterium]